MWSFLGTVQKCRVCSDSIAMLRFVVSLRTGHFLLHGTFYQYVPVKCRKTKQKTSFTEPGSVYSCRCCYFGKWHPKSAHKFPVLIFQFCQPVVCTVLYVPACHGRSGGAARLPAMLHLGPGGWESISRAMVNPCHMFSPSAPFHICRIHFPF